MRVLTGRWTVDFLVELNIAMAFISAAGITLEHGLTTSRSALADTLNAAADAAETEGRAAGLDEVQALLAADRSGARQSLDLIITDDGLDPEVAESSARRA